MNKTPNILTSISSFFKVSWNILFVIIYPVITAFSLVFVGVIYFFSAISTLVSKLPIGRENVEESKKPEWELFVKGANFQVEHKFADEIMFGPSYYRLKASPRVELLERNFFGDFIYPCFDGFLLQRWNTTVAKELPDFTLVFLNGITGELKELARVNAFTWDVSQVNEELVKIKWLNGSKSGEVLINKEDV